MAKNEMILCDTNIFIQFLNGREKVKNALKKVGTESIALSIITYAELFYGTRKAEINAMKAFLYSFIVLDIDAGISKVFKGLVLNYSYNYQRFRMPLLRQQLFTTDCNYILRIKRILILFRK